MNRTFFGQPVGPQIPQMFQQVRPAEAGAEPENTPDGKMLSMVGQIGITQEDVDNALKTLEIYRNGKKSIESQAIEDERWYQLRHWEYLRRQSGDPENQSHPQPEPASGWLFNSLANKHADAMDNYPEPNILPREKSDEKDAKQLSEIVPVILERCDFEGVYSHNWWEKLKHGTGIYSVLWDTSLGNGLGDISIKPVDLLNIFWEPGISDIQDSRNVFLVSLVDNDILLSQYPQLDGRLGKGSDKTDVAQYVHDDSIDISDKSAVVDWYYKTKAPSGKTLLHYAKIAGGMLLYASQNDDAYRDSGWYEHGMYPFVFDRLFPEKGYPTGFGYISVCKDPQLYIDKLQANIMENSMQNSKIRFIVSDDTDINEDELLDYNKPLIHCAGRIDDAKIKQLVTTPLDPVIVNVLQLKIDEMKETASNRDVSQGGTTGGATAAAAIAALQEAGNKVSRDIIGGSYRTYRKIDYMVIELIRQFYDEKREFRITQPNGAYEFVDFSNATMKEQPTGTSADGLQTYRVPIFDIKIRAQKRSPFAREAQNQRAMELYQSGFFNPENATPSLACLDMMEFEGIDKVRQNVSQGQTLFSIIQQMSAKLDTAMQMLGASKAPHEPEEGESSPQQGRKQEPAKNPLEMTPMGKSMAANATPNAAGN